MTCQAAAIFSQVQTQIRTFGGSESRWRRWVQPQKTLPLANDLESGIHGLTLTVDGSALVTVDAFIVAMPRPTVGFLAHWLMCLTLMLMGVVALRTIRRPRAASLDVRSLQVMER